LVFHTVGGIADLTLVSLQKNGLAHVAALLSFAGIREASDLTQPFTNTSASATQEEGTLSTHGAYFHTPSDHIDH
jgi:hypothetical protein